MGKTLRPDRIIIVLSLILIGQSCSVEKNTNISRLYHNLTSNYNIYFNAHESYLSGVKRIKDACQDNYSSIMPVFEYSDENTAKSGSSDMDRVIQKASKLISLHSMTTKPELENNGQLSEKEKEFYDRKEYNNWVDDSYLLMGKAQMLKHQFHKARITFLHNIRESHDEQMKAESTIWLARTYNEIGNYLEANRLLSETVESDLDESLRGDYYLTLTDMFARQGQYNKAAEQLTKALSHISGNRNKNRLTFILAKLNEKLGNSAAATENYKEVLRLSPPYEMEFNAKISQAGVFDVSTGDVDEIRKELNKLLRDSKNKEYLDQIYFALGNLSMREGNIEEAIEYIKQSATASTINTNQKGRSYLMLADYYFEEPDYRISQVYYDSAVTFLNEEYPGYNEYNERSLNLNELSRHIDIIEREDSLQHIASLSPSQRDNVINKIINEIKEKERLAKTETDTRYNMGQFYENQRRFRDNIEESGKWYFYNQAALTFGRTEFRNRWGDRKLENNWRRKNQAGTGSVGGNFNEREEQQADSINPETDIKSKEYYLKNLPLNDSLLAISNNRIAAALFNAGETYHERFNDREKANDRYDTYMERFPDHIEVPQALYNLYQINKEADPVLADGYKNQLINRFPDTEFARMLSIPDYFKLIIRDGQRSENVYHKAYSAYENENFSNAVIICDSAILKFPESELLPKFLLLRAFSLAPSINEKSLKEELNKIISQHKGSDEAIRASELVAYLNKEIPELKLEEEQNIAREIYDTIRSGTFNFILIIKNKDLDINRLTFDVINYNIDNYTNENYNTRGELVDDRYIMITVAAFKTDAQAMQYYYNFDPSGILGSASETATLFFIINPSNLASLGSDKDPDRYFLFFKEFFLDENN